jgi:plastocyanin
MNKTFAVVIVVILLLIGGAYALNHNKSNNSTPAANNSGTSQSTNSNNTSSNATAAAGKIEIKNMMFTPPQITVHKGDAVVWTNNDNTTHTVIDDLSNVGGPASGNVEPGSSYSFTFTKTGSFQYHCSIHPSMRGTIVVQ